MNNIRKTINNNISQRNTVVKYYLYQDINLQYGVIKMLARHWKTDVRTAYRMYADWLVTGVYTPSK